MKSLLIIASLAATFLATPTIAQLGPAGVPGAPGLAETDPSVIQKAPTNAPQAQVQQQKAIETDCSKTKNAAQCKKRQEARKKTQERECSKASDPARCEQFQRTRALCKDKPSQEYRQCLRDNLAPKK